MLAVELVGWVLQGCCCGVKLSNPHSTWLFVGVHVDHTKVCIELVALIKTHMRVPRSFGSIIRPFFLAPIVDCCALPLSWSTAAGTARN